MKNEKIISREALLHRLRIDDLIQKHGSWISTRTGEDEYYECSECGHLFIILEGTPEENEMFYCPRCGARLDGKVMRNGEYRRKGQ